MFPDLNTLRENAHSLFGNKEWMNSITEGKRNVTVCLDGLYCSSTDPFDDEFVTDDIETAVDYLYPQL